MTDIQSKDYTKMLKELAKPYGCYGIKTTVGFGEWIDQWIANGGDQQALEGLFMIVDQSTTHMTMWVSKEVFPNVY